MTNNKMGKYLITGAGGFIGGHLVKELMKQGYDVRGVENNSVTLGNADVTAVYMSQDEGATAYGAIFKGSTSMQTPLIEYTDGDDALTIADGGALTTAGNLSLGGSNNELRFYEGSNYVGFEAPSLSADQVWSLPTADGSANQVLKTDGSGALSWSTPSTSSTTVTVTDNENTNEGNALIFAADADLDGGTIGLESDGDATYNPSTGTIAATNFSGNLTGTLQTAAQPNVTSVGTLGSVDIDGGAIDGTAIGANSASTGAFTTITASTSVDVTGSAGVILENDETITNATDGTVLINGTVAGGTGSAAGVFTSNGDQDVTIQTGNSTTGSITITDGANGNIAITPNGSGAVQLDGLSWPTADGSANQVLKTDGSGALSWTTSSSGASNVNGLSDALVEDNSMYIGQDPSSTTSTAEYNVSVGATALDAITTGFSNTAVGYNSLTANLEGDRNTAIGANALKSNTSGITNVAVGSSALERNTIFFILANLLILCIEL